MRPKIENETRKESCVTRIEEVDDVEHEKLEEPRRKRKSLEKRRPHENTILDNQANRKQLNTRRRIFHSAVGADSASREGAARMIVAKQLKKRDKSQKSVWTACVFMGDEKEGKTLALLLARERVTRAVVSSVVPSRRETGHVGG